ncbi:MAG: MlaD family protein [Bacteroidales bacterium]|jgi:phospholipid/cholesterol/gamma-HCH transport system substrate-binding protein|nr:MlaD family protein [Bacteroidales bacterium]HHT53170.1 MCE family protein [Bacteroidales bacterium]
MEEQKENKRGMRAIFQKNRKAIMVAIMAIAAIIIFYAGANFLKGAEMFGGNRKLYAIFDDAAGLPQGTPVMYNGFKIGKVMTVSLTSDSPARVCAAIAINEDMDIPKDSHFELSTKDMLGGLVIHLRLGEAKQLAKNKDTLQSFLIPAFTDGLGDVMVQLSSIMSSVDSIALELKGIVSSKEGSSSLKIIFENLENSTTELNQLMSQNRAKFGHIVDNLNQLTTTLNEETPQLQSIIDNFDQISDDIAKADLAKVILEANQTIEQLSLIVEKIQKGEGDIGKLVNNEELYNNLALTTENLNKLLIDIKENPDRYIHVSVFGKKKK